MKRRQKQEVIISSELPYKRAVKAHLPMGGARTTTCMCFLGSDVEKTSDNSSSGCSDSPSERPRTLGSSLREPFAGMDTFHRTRVLVSTCWNACFFSIQIAFLREPTDSVLSILTGKMLRRSSPWTKQLSSRMRLVNDGPEGELDCVADEMI